MSLTLSGKTYFVISKNGKIIYLYVRTFNVRMQSLKKKNYAGRKKNREKSFWSTKFPLFYTQYKMVFSWKSTSAHSGLDAPIMEKHISNIKISEKNAGVHPNILYFTKKSFIFFYLLKRQKSSVFLVHVSI